MSQEPHPPTDRTSPGSTPSEGAGARTELERQRAEGELPGRPTRDPFHGDDADDADDGDTPDDEQADVEVPPTESVPDDVAEDAARSTDPREARPVDRDQDASAADPMRRAPSTSDVRGLPGGGGD